MPTVSANTKTLQLRLKDKHAKVLHQMEREVNQVWSHINEVPVKAACPFHSKPKYLSYGLQKCTAGYSRSGGISVGSGTVQRVYVEYVTQRKQFKKRQLNWCVSNPDYSLGWIPFKDGHIHFARQKLSLLGNYALSKYKLRGSSFRQDRRGIGASMSLDVNHPPPEITESL